MQDDERESAIAWTSLALQTEKSVAKRRVLFDELRTLIAGRSREKVRELEIAKGIHTPAPF